MPELRKRKTPDPSTETVPVKKQRTYKQGEFVTYIAKSATSQYTELQTKACQSYGIKSREFEKCISCIEKQAIFGNCRFNKLRVFKLIEGESAREHSTEESNNTVTNWSRSGPKVDFTSRDYVFVGNQPEDYVPYSSLNWAQAPEPSEDTNREEGKPTKAKTTKAINIPLPPATRRSARVRIAADSAEKAGNGIENKVNYSKSPESVQRHAEYALRLIAPTFARALEREKKHEDLNLIHTQLNGGAAQKQDWQTPRPLVRITPTEETRSLCDLCATTIFLGSYLCGVCGREFCIGCWEEWTESNPQMAHCSYRRRHQRSAMVFVTRAAKGEINDLLCRVKAYQEKKSSNIILPSLPDSQLTSKLVSSPSLNSTHPQYTHPSFLPVPKTSVNTLSFSTFQSHWLRSRGTPLVLTDFLPRFELPWNANYFLGNYGHQRCLLHSCGLDNKIIEGTVSDFFSGFENSLLQGTISDQIISSIGSWKLKDWPPSDDFAKIFPNLFRDFENALPFPEYTTREGVLNLAARFPKGWNRPDLGPKMYNAYPSLDFLPIEPDEDNLTKANRKSVKPKKVTFASLNSPENRIDPSTGLPIVKGTTNLHLDITDAINIMLYASGGENASPLATDVKGIPLSGAIWDIFPPDSAGKIRTYLRKKYDPNGDLVDDPIHRQNFYLDEVDLVELNKEANGGVQAWRIFQDPGDAIFIPAGCPHQVRNRRSCVKVAVDFLSPEGVQVCEGLLEEGRRLAGVGYRPSGGLPNGEDAEKTEGKGDNDKEGGSAATSGVATKSLGKREDVLQLWNCLYFCWSEMERELQGRRKVDTSADSQAIKKENSEGKEENLKELIAERHMKEMVVRD